MKRTYINLAVAVPVLVVFIGSLIFASLTEPDTCPVGVMLGLSLLMLVGVSGWWLSRQIFKSL
jgi:hypothetical protein